MREIQLGTKIPYGISYRKGYPANLYFIRIPIFIWYGHYNNLSEGIEFNSWKRYDLVFNFAGGFSPVPFGEKKNIVDYYGRQT